MRVKIILLFGFLLLISTGIVFFFYYQAKTARGLDLELSVSERSVKVGVPFEIKVKISNSSNNVLQNTVLTVNLPEGLVFLGPVEDKTIESKAIGSLGSGSITEESFRAIAVGGEQSVKIIKANVSYVPTSLGGSVFEQTAKADVNVVGSGIEMDISSPEKVFSGEVLEIVVKYRNSSAIDFRNLKLVLDHPAAFEIISSSLEPDVFNKNSWDFGDLRPNSDGEVSIKGRVNGPDGAFYDLKIFLTAEFFGNNYVVFEKTATLSISPSPLSLSIGVNDDPNYIAGPGEDLFYTIGYLNNTEVALKDVIITAKLTGEMFDLSRVETSGFLQGTQNSIIWNAARVPELANILPGTGGSVHFRLRTKNAYPITRIGDRNFTLKVNAQIESPTVPYFVSAEKTLGQAELITKVRGRLIGAAKGFFRDANSGILNSGPMPPQVGESTQFTLHWELANTSTEMQNITLRAFLGPNVIFTGVTKSDLATSPVYNPRTQEVVWEIDRLAATKGFLTEPAKAIFQVSLTPSLDQQGSFATLIGETSLTATDTFTGETFNAKFDGVTTQLKDDPTVGSQGVVR